MKYMVHISNDGTENLLQDTWDVLFVHTDPKKGVNVNLVQG